ncbi:FecR family protein [Sphingobacterium mizutaii]|uniref:FecR family protein n=1 Tax=Sphingobacterium mizutaii TaxID=1010 RepID=UPI00162AC550|nr:FecR domain-containing protein [Sphingobacterium mizutaii]
MNKEEIKELLERYRAGLCSEDECKQIQHQIVKNPIVGNWEWSDDQHRNFTKNLIKQGLPILSQQRSGRIKRIRLGLFAAVAIIMIIGIWNFYLENPPINVQTYKIAQAKNYSNNEKVTITLPNGNVQILDGKFLSSTLETNLVQGKKESSTEMWLTIKVPGRQHQEVVLPDGTTVWLNAGSTLRFPHSFPKNYRHVFLQGEGYFEVAHDERKSFHVYGEKGEIEVTGTKFNLQVYNDQNLIRTSLLEGGVLFHLNDKVHKLTPGLELVANTDKNEIVRQKFDSNKLISWKDGYFTFDNMDLLEVMLLVSRWYNITVISEVNLNSKKIGGTYPTNLPLDELLEDLSTLSDVKFEMNGKEVYIVH